MGQRSSPRPELLRTRSCVSRRPVLGPLHLRLYRKPKGVVHTTGGHLLGVALTRVKCASTLHPLIKFTQFYSAPTAKRRLGKHHVAGYDLSSLRILCGGAYQPRSVEVLMWGRDSGWSSIRSGSTVFTRRHETKHGLAILVPFLGIDPAVLDTTTGVELHENSVSGVHALGSQNSLAFHRTHDLGGS